MLESGELGLCSPRKFVGLGPSEWVNCRIFLLGLLITTGLSACFDSTLRIEPRVDIEGADDEEFVLPSNGFDKVDLPDVRDPSRDVPLTLTRVDPATGPSIGGGKVRLIGSAFTEGAQVFFGGQRVASADVAFVNGNELLVELPVGHVGVVTVVVELGSGETVSLANAFEYHGLVVTPGQGPPSGGSLIEVTVDGPMLGEGPRAAEIAFLVGGNPCTDLHVVTPSRFRCRTPAGPSGKADVRLIGPSGTGWVVNAPQAFEYTLGEESVNGGLRGGPIAGNLDVTVVDSLLKLGVPGVRVVAERPGGPPIHGLTDSAGRVVLADPQLTGPVTVHAALECFETTSIVAFDASQVGIILRPTAELRCVEDLELELEEQQGQGGSGGGGSGGRRSVGTAGAQVSGVLRFAGESEFGDNGWTIIPEPKPGEVRVVYVYATRASVFSGEVDPALGQSRQRIVEDASGAAGHFGVPYSIFTRPAGLAVYALGGLEDMTTGRFIPYVMGVRRDVVTAPATVTEGVDIVMAIPLDRALKFSFSTAVTGDDIGPLEYRASIFMDLGAEGFVKRVVNGKPLDTRVGYRADELFAFFGQPAAEGVISDLRYSALAGWYTGSYADFPYTEALLEGIVPSQTPISISSMLDVPKEVLPKRGQVLPRDRTLRWQATAPNPQLYVVNLYLADGTPVWEQIVPGSNRSAVLPDLSEFPESGGLPSGRMHWSVRGLRVRGFEYNRFDYSALQSRHWTHDTVNEFFFEVR